MSANYLYLEIVVTDFRAANAHRKGAGAALVQHAKAFAKQLGKEVMYVDCWAENEEKLVKFYEGQGFTRVVDFLVERHDSPGWPGMFLQMEL